MAAARPEHSGGNTVVTEVCAFATMRTGAGRESIASWFSGLDAAQADLIEFTEMHLDEGPIAAHDEPAYPQFTCGYTPKCGERSPPAIKIGAHWPCRAKSILTPLSTMWRGSDLQECDFWHSCCS